MPGAFGVSRVSVAFRHGLIRVWLGVTASMRGRITLLLMEERVIGESLRPPAGKKMCPSSPIVFGMGPRSAKKTRCRPGQAAKEPKQHPAAPEVFRIFAASCGIREKSRSI